MPDAFGHPAITIRRNLGCKKISTVRDLSECIQLHNDKAQHFIISSNNDNNYYYSMAQSTT
jgi:hypothetical protein